jgi:predicted Zn-dependent peptidase
MTLMFVLAGAIAACAGPGAAAAQARPAPRAPVRIAYTQETLPNGLRVVYHVDHAAPVAAVDIWYHVGSKHEREGRTGLAHLFEHMMFKGSRHVADGQHWALLERAGARGGTDVNGTTAHDRTNFFEQVPSHQLELALWLESERMGTLLETLTQEKLDNQREVVKNERRQGMDNQPYGSWYEEMLARVFPAGHPYHHSIIGSMDDLSAATLDDVRGFFRTWYAPNNAVLVVAGDIDLARTRAMVRRHFGWIPRGPEPPPLARMALPPLIGAPARAVIADPHAHAAAVYLGFRMPAHRDPDGPAVVLLAGMIGEGRASPLHEALVRNARIATQAGAGNIWLIDGADLFTVSAQGAPGVTADSLEAALLRALDHAVASLTQEALDRVRAGLRVQYVDGLQSLGGFAGRADRLAEGATWYGDPGWVNRRLDRFEAVTLAQVRALARARLVPANRATLVYLPREPRAGGSEAP